jgi:tetratricopeptide (TPR) repeat protein
MTTPALATENPYLALFHEYICAGLRQAAARVREAEPLVPEPEREQAWHLLSYAFQVDEAWPLTRELLQALAPKMEQAGFRGEWLPYLNHALDLAQKNVDQSACAAIALWLGQMHRLLSDYETADQHVLAAIALASATGSAWDQAHALNERAWLKYLQQDFATAQALAQQALALLAPDDPERGMSHRVLGMIAVEQGQWHEAESQHRTALAFFQRQPEQRKSVWALQNLGAALSGQARYAEAIACYQQAIDLMSQLGDIYNQSIARMNLGITFFHTGQLEDALEQFQIAEHHFRKLADRLNQAKITNNLGLLYIHLQRYDQAEQMFRISIDLYQQLKDVGRGLNAMDGLAMALLAQGRNTEALAILDAALERLQSAPQLPNYNYLLNSLQTHRAEALAAPKG